MKNLRNKIALMLPASTLALCVNAFADDGSAVAASVGTALTTVQVDIMSVLSTVAPIAISVFGALLVWRFGKKFFSMIAK